jgi:hypothetical protein
MKATCKHVFMFAIVLALATGLGLAKSDNKSDQKSANITITTLTATPDGQLQPGTYRMELLNASTATPEVAFYQGKKLICKCPVKIETLPTKAAYTQLFVETNATGTRLLRTVSIGGWSEKVIFSEATAPGSGR